MSGTYVYIFFEYHLWKAQPVKYLTIKPFSRILPIFILKLEFVTSFTYLISFLNRVNLGLSLVIDVIKESLVNHLIESHGMVSLLLFFTLHSLGWKKPDGIWKYPNRSKKKLFFPQCKENLFFFSFHKLLFVMSFFFWFPVVVSFSLAQCRRNVLKKLVAI